MTRLGRQTWMRLTNHGMMLMLMLILIPTIMLPMTVEHAFIPFEIELRLREIMTAGSIHAYV